MSNDQQPLDFKSVKSRIAEIAEEVDDDSLSLDAALDLYEEAVALGLKASDLLEVGITPEDEAEAAGADDAALPSGEAAAAKADDAALPSDETTAAENTVDRQA